MLALTVNGTPASGPTGSPAASRASRAAAAARAASGSTVTTALTDGFTASMRARWASITSTAENFCAITPAAISDADSWVSSIGSAPLAAAFLVTIGPYLPTPIAGASGFRPPLAHPGRTVVRSRRRQLKRSLQAGGYLAVAAD